MEIIRGLHNLRPHHRGAAVTIGNFDGVHLGHRAILEQLAAIGAGAGVPTMLVTFEPHPGEFFAAGHPPARLTRFREKMIIMSRLPLDRVLVLRFDEAFSMTSATDFIQHYLVGGLGLKHLLVGDDFRFGNRAEGDFGLLKALSAAGGFALSRRDTFSLNGERVSSNRIREALKSGALNTAARLLGRTYFMLGRVVRGRRLGRSLGFATANLPVRRRACPLSGVFAVEVEAAGLPRFQGMANVGSRPTVDGNTTLLEVHLFDFDGELYGRELRVDFLVRLRDEQRFENVEMLKAQLARDMANARAALGALSPYKTRAARDKNVFL